MGVNSLPKTVTGQRRGCDLNPGPTAPESSTLTTRLPSHLATCCEVKRYIYGVFDVLGGLVHVRGTPGGLTRRAFLSYSASVDGRVGVVTVLGIQRPCRGAPLSHRDSPRLRTPRFRRESVHD